MSLIHLIYVSTATHEFDTAELDGLLAQAATKNTTGALTGMLLYAGGCFMQVLEGEAADVDATFARIARDPRHSDIVVLERGPIEARSFPNWRMGFRRLDATTAAQHPAWAPFITNGFDAARLGAKPGLALDLLTSFGTTQRD